MQKINAYLPLVARVLLGLVFTVFGLNGFFGFMSMPPMPDAANDFMGALAQSGYFMPFLKAVETLAGIALLAGFFAPTVLQNLAGGVVPNAVDKREAYGLAVVAGGQFSPKYSTELSLGGGVYTADAAAERFGVKSTIVNAGA